MSNFQKLTVVILSYNRPYNLSKLIFKIYPLVKKHKIRLIILDDASSFKIKSIMRIFSKNYKYFQYIRNKKNIGHDKNFLKALNLCKTDYLWVVSDSLNFNKKNFIGLEKYLNGKNDLIIIKSKERDLNISQKQKRFDKNLFLESLAWHCCLLGSSLISKKLFKNKTYSNLKSFKNFPHIGLIFSFAADNKLNFKIYSKKILSSFNKESYWVRSIFDVFLNDWSNSIMQLKNYDFYSKRIAIINHDKFVRLFSFKNLIILKAKNILTIKSFIKNFQKLRKYTQANLILVFFIVLIPQILLSQLIKIYYRYIR